MKEWETEEDFYEGIDDETSYVCRIKRMDSMGHLCGYVALPKGHSLYGKHYDDEAVDVQVHGGLTYAEESNDKKSWVFGFDCSHSGDLIPYSNTTKEVMDFFNDMIGDTRFDKGIYRTMDYVKEQIRNLAGQLSALNTNMKGKS